MDVELLTELGEWDGPAPLDSRVDAPLCSRSCKTTAHYEIRPPAEVVRINLRWLLPSDSTNTMAPLHYARTIVVRVPQNRNRWLIDDSRYRPGVSVLVSVTNRWRVRA